MYTMSVETPRIDFIIRNAKAYYLFLCKKEEIKHLHVVGDLRNFGNSEEKRLDSARKWIAYQR